MTDIKIPGFELIELVGCGGMAEVWKARQVSLDREVAIKILSSDFSSDPADVDRFQEEARAAARLKHSGIVQVYDASTADGMYFFVMEFVAGYTVGNWLRRKGVLKEADALVVCECVADALDYAWSQARIIHCDIKPDNVIVDADGTVKIADLGLSRTISAMSRLTEAAEEEVMGTPSYISPEQAMGTPDLDCRADIYSLGAMLYHLATGHRPFEGFPDAEVMEQQCTGQLESPVNIAPEVSVPLCMLLEKMMAKDKSHRHTDWHEVKTDIARVKRHHPPRVPLAPSAATTVTRAPRPQRHRRPDPVHSNLRRWKKHDPSSLLALAIVGGIFVVFLVIWLVTRMASSPAYAPPSPARVEPSTGTHDATRDQRAAALVGEVRAWIAAHPGQWTGARQRLGDARARVAGTTYVAEIDRQLNALEQRLSNATERVKATLRAESEQLEAAGRKTAAAGVYVNYSGELVDETLTWRMGMAAAVGRRTRHVTEEPPPPVEPVALDLDETMARVVDTLMADGPAAAALVLQTAASGGKAGQHEARLRGLETVLLDAAQLDKRVIESFRESIGQEVDVHLTTGTRTIRVVRVADGRVSGMAQRASSGVVKLPVSFTIRDLYITERLKRMGDDVLPEVALGKGLMAVNANALSRAHDFFARTHELIARPLQEYVTRKLREDASAVPETAGDPVVATPAVGPRRAAVPHELEAIRDDAAAVRSLLLDKNPRLNPEHVAIGMEDGKATTIRISSSAIMDIGPLAALTTLTSFVLDVPKRETAPLQGIDALENLPLTRVVLDRSRVGDIGALQAAPLTHVSLRNAPVRHLAPLRGKVLTYLDVSESSVLDFGPLAGMPLEYLAFSGTSMRRLSVLSAMPLRVLKAAETPLSDLSVIEGVHLTQLDIAGTSVRDVSVLAGMPLDVLNISHTRVADILPLAGLDLSCLSMAGTPVTDFSPFKEMTLSSLNVSESSFSDVGLLAGMPLRSLDCHNTRVTDLWALAGKPLASLVISDTAVSDVSSLKDLPLERFSCRSTRVSDFGPLRGAPIERLDIDNPKRHSGFVRSLGKLTFLNGKNLFYATESPFRRSRVNR